MTDVPLPPRGDTDWEDWAREQERLSDAAREIESGRLTDANLRATFPVSAEIRTIKRITQADYDALPTKDAATLYVIVG